MNQPLADRLRHVVSRFAVGPAGAFRVAGAEFSVDDARWRRFPTPPEATSPLIRAVAGALYVHEYCGTPVDAPPADSWAPDAAFQALLSAANPTRDAWEPGWRVDEVAASGELRVSKSGRFRVAPRGTYFPETLQPRIGSFVALRVRRDERPQAGAYLVHSQTLPDQAEDRDNLRFYFHCEADEAARVLRSVAAAFNSYAMPFRLKCLDHPRLYDRADSVVLYVERRHAQLASRLLRHMHRDGDWRLRPATPLFAQAWLPGLAVAEDPSGGESFGQHRCRLLAEALLAASQSLAPSQSPAWNDVVRELQRRGLDLDRPHLNPGAVDWLELEPPRDERHLAGCQTPRVADETPGEVERRAPHFDAVHPSTAPLSPPTAVTGSFGAGAAALGRWIVRETIWSSNGCGWLDSFATETAPGVPPIVTSYPDDLRKGAAGIAIFLARAAAPLQSPLFAEVASATIDRLAKTVRHFDEPATSPEQFAWRTEIVAALYELAIRLDRHEIVDVTLRAAQHLASYGATHPESLVPAALPTLLQLATHAGVDPLVRSLDACFSSVRTRLLSLPRSSGHATATPGAVAATLLALARSYDDATCQEAACVVLDRSADRWTGEVWPELRTDLPRTEPIDPRWRADVRDLARAMCQAGRGALCADAIERQLEVSSRIAGSMIRPPCFVDPVLADLLHAVHRATGDFRMARRLEQLAEFARRSASEHGQPWDLATGFEQPPLSLQDGLAGVGHFLLRLAFPDTPGMFEFDFR